MTAAHCVAKTFSYNAQTLSINTNKFYPTFASMFTVYAGINDISFLTNGSLDLIPYKDVLHLVSNKLKHIQVMVFRPRQENH